MKNVKLKAKDYVKQKQIIFQEEEKEKIKEIERKQKEYQELINENKPKVQQRHKEEE